MEPKVSIICNTYNHENYIAQALDSFLAQKTDFPIEVLVHDDASTDGTASIIRQYADKYPDIIKPILQTENQFSKGVHVTYDIQVPRAQGKYIAFCEGDDYWTDPEKLQLQFAFMENYPEYASCCHAYDMVDVNGEILDHRRDFIGDCDLEMKHLVGNQLEVPQFATFFTRSDVLKMCGATFLDTHIVDMVFRVRCVLYGKIRYFDRVMSAYRRFVAGSWTMTEGFQKERFAKNLEQYIPFFQKLDDYTGGQYHAVLQKAADDRAFQASLLRSNYRAARKCAAYKTAPMWKRVAISVGCVFPKSVAFLETLREKR